MISKVVMSKTAPGGAGIFLLVLDKRKQYLDIPREIKNIEHNEVNIPITTSIYATIVTSKNHGSIQSD